MKKSFVNKNCICPIRRTHQGSGFMDVVKMEKQNERPQFEGEMHAISVPFSNVSYNYMGPFTQVTKRLQRGDPPINDLDKVAMTHDIDYLKAGNDLKNGIIDKPTFIKKIKAADTLFRQDAKKTKDAPLLKHVAEKMILAKEIAEDSGLIPTSVFSGGKKKKKEKKAYPADRLRMLVEHEKNINKGQNKRLEVKTGGFLFPLAAAGAALLSGALASLAGKAVDSLFDYFTGKKGSGTNESNDKQLSKDEKIKFLVENVKPEELLKLVSKK